MAPLCLTHSIDCQILLAQSLAFKTPLPIEITIFLEITARDNPTPMTTSFIFCNKSSLTRLGLPRLLKIGGSESSFWLLNLRFQLLIDVF